MQVCMQVVVVHMHTTPRQVPNCLHPLEREQHSNLSKSNRGLVYMLHDHFTSFRIQEQGLKQDGGAAIAS